MYYKASEIYNEFLEIYFHKYCGLLDDKKKKKKKIESKYNSKDLFIDGCDDKVLS